MRGFKRFCRERSDWSSLRFPWLMLFLGPIALTVLAFLAVWSHTDEVNNGSDFRDPT